MTPLARPSLPRYRFGARFYDVLSAERLVYRRGRLAAFELLDLRPGQRVLLVGCGTGLDLPLVAEAVGKGGEVVGVDASASMLTQARAKVPAAGWPRVRLVLGNAAELPQVGGGFDAVMFTYSLSVIQAWRPAWEQAISRLAPGGQVSVVDTDLPTGAGLGWTPLAALALWTGGVDRSRQVWRLVTEQARDVQTRSLAHGHIQVAVGRLGTAR